MNAATPHAIDVATRIRHEAGGRSVAFVSGNFNIVHPGHLRLLNFAAECGQFLVVGVNDNHAEDTFLDEQHRLEAVQSIGVVNHAFILRAPVAAYLAALRPDVVIKGKEHEGGHNPEQAAISAYGGRLIFSSGEVLFSSLDLLQRELRETRLSTITKPRDFPARHHFADAGLVEVVARFSSLRVLVIGDLVVNEYITCDPLGMSREDPTIVVTPIRSDRFVGGAGIVAAHARGLGARVDFFTVGGEGDALAFARERLAQFGVSASIFVDASRPTTLKQRFRASGKTLLRVSHLRQHDIGRPLAAELVRDICARLDDIDLVVFSDFNYGCLPQEVVDAVGAECARRGISAVADSQSSSQLSDISRFKGMRLITPTEHEARLAMRDHGTGLVVLAESLRRQAGADNVIVTLGGEGLLVQSGRPGHHGLVTDQLPALNSAPKDVSGAGDSLVTCAAMALAVGVDIWQAAYLGSLAAACQVGRVGNTPLSAAELIAELRA